LEWQAPPLRRIQGMVRDQASGRPLAGVKLRVQPGEASGLTDAQGYFEIISGRSSPLCQLVAEPGPPYFAALTQVPDVAGESSPNMNFDLIRGILLQGRVVDPMTGKAPRAGIVEYYPLFPNPHSYKLHNGLSKAASFALIQPDGSFRLAVLPGTGVVCAAVSPRSTYAVACVDEQPGISQRLSTAVGEGGTGVLCVDKYQALAFIDPSETATPLKLDLQTAITRQGSVVDREGRPVPGVQFIGSTALPYQEVLDGSSFSVTGLNPRRSRVLFFQHRELHLGKFLTIQGDTTDPLNVQLEPCGLVQGRLVNRYGNPVPDQTIYFLREGEFMDILAQTDARGAFRAYLVPGPDYRLGVSSSEPRLKEEITLRLQPAQVKDLGNLTLKD
jgi:hypothetical protein